MGYLAPIKRIDDNKDSRFQFKFGVVSLGFTGEYDHFSTYIKNPDILILRWRLVLMSVDLGSKALLVY